MAERFRRIYADSTRNASLNIRLCRWVSSHPDQVSTPDSSMNFLTPTVILVILLLLITVGLWLQFALLRTRMSNRLGRLEERLGENEQVLDLQLKRLGEVKDQNDLLIEGTNAAKIIMEALHRDVNRLADGVRGEVGMSKAIELARAGATKEAVADETGISLAEAEAIVTFHGKKKV